MCSLSLFLPIQILFSQTSSVYNNEAEGRLLHLDDSDEEALTMERQPLDHSSCEVNNPLTLRLNPHSAI